MGDKSPESVCLCVRLTLLAERIDIQTWIMAWMSSGRISRSSLLVKVVGQRSRSWGQKMFIGTIYWLLRANVNLNLSKKNSEILLVGIRHGVFPKHMCFFFNITYWTVSTSLPPTSLPKIMTASLSPQYKTCCHVSHGRTGSVLLVNQIYWQRTKP